MGRGSFMNEDEKAFSNENDNYNENLYEGG